MPAPPIPAPAVFGLRPRVFFLAILAAGLVFSYARVLDAPFVHDDLFQIRDQPRVQRVLAGQDSIFSLLIPHPNHRRPLPFFTFALNLRWFGDGTRSFHLVNLGLHFFNVLILLGLTRRMARILTGSEPPFWPLALGALLWAFQPVHTQAVTYIVQRMTLLSAFFALVSLWCWVEAGERSGRRRAGLYLASGAAGLMALLSKESAASLPLLVLLWEWLSPRVSRRRLAGLSVATAALYAAGILLLVHFSADELSTYSNRYGFLADRLRSQPRMLWHHLSLIALPHPARMVMEGQPVFSTGLFSPPVTAPALAGLLLLLSAAVALARRRSLVGFGLLFFFIALLPESGFWPIALQADHRVYLPASLLIAGIGAAAAAGPRPRLRAGLISAILTLLCLLTTGRNQAWQSEGALWRDTVAKAPEHYPNWQNLAAVHMRQRKISATLVALNRVRKLDPANFKVHLTQAYLFLTMNRLPLFRAMRLGGRSCEVLRQTVDLDPVEALALAQCEAEEGRTRNAIELEEQAARRNPKVTFLPWFMAYDLATEGQRDRALKIIEAAEQNPPGYESLLQRGLLALQAGDHEKAADYYRQALASRPDGIEALMGMGQALEKTHPARAVEFFRQAREIDPALALATDAWCGALAAAGDPRASAACRLADLQDPLLAVGWKNRGRDLLMRRDYADAAECLAHAALLSPADREIAELARAANAGMAETTP